MCDTTESVCFNGDITWNKNRKMIHISGKLTSDSEPGDLVFWFSGIQGSGAQVYMDTRLPIRGHDGEFIDKKLIMPYSSETTWSLQKISYEEEQKSVQ